jgi:hypothetical protein
MAQGKLTAEEIRVAIKTLEETVKRNYVVLPDTPENRALEQFVNHAALDSICPACFSEQLMKVKGCIRCLACGYKQDCNGY